MSRPGSGADPRLDGVEPGEGGAEPGEGGAEPGEGGAEPAEGLAEAPLSSLSSLLGAGFGGGSTCAGDRTCD